MSLNSIIRKSLEVLVIIAGSIILLGVLFTTLNPDYSTYAVRSGSMEPAISTGSLIIIKSVSNYSTLQKGEIITFKDEGHTTTHRIYDISQDQDSFSFVTKGDANQNPDSEPVPESDINGKFVLEIPYIGGLIRFLNTVPGVIMLVVMPSIFIITYEVRDILSEIR